MTPLNAFSASSDSTSSDDESAAETDIVPAPRLPITSECKHYVDRNEVPWDIQKYYDQRFSIFSRYRDDIRLTDEAWYGVTPEPVANAIALRTSCIHKDKTILIDAFAGAGGNTIAFALSGHWQRIFAIERDAATLACAQHNASVYGVDESIITWIQADSFHFLDAVAACYSGLDPDLRIYDGSAVVFASPPWGGPGYRTDKIFNLETMLPYNISRLHSAYQGLDHMLYLPRTSDLEQIASLAPEATKIEVTQYCVRGASKGMVAYIPGDKSKLPILH
ncbi:hypothetical protein CDD80_3673 [Ophiocordyceps camponoti-rufipedis]|uniref:Trimethylguanosine synthase n=1 Tax=Ophiocordyceps camponoti-rufipedis TaxID=2004952 RepID=A0A2C5XII0_9HYPO|nr:hypothetical protein CDD80_3673 [Ophiocordyceps camponoti-rufipedis]